MNRLSPSGKQTVIDDASRKSLKTSSSSTKTSSSNRHAVLDSSPNLPKLNFPAKLHLILSTPEFNDIICWLPHGRAWRVQQQDKLETDILPKFFQHQKAASFYRQVTGWGFHRVVSGTDFNAYYHELFLRDAPDLCRKMKRPTRTELSERKQALPKAPPDFYVMPPVTEEIMNNADPYSYHTEHKMTLGEHKDMLVRRLSTYSLTEKGMYLQLEMNKLEKKKSEIMKQLKEMGGSTLHSTITANNTDISMTNANNIGSSTQQQQQLLAATNGMKTTTIPPPTSNLIDHHPLLLNNNNFQPSAAAVALNNPFQSLLQLNNNNNNQVSSSSSSTAAPSPLDQLRLELMQQMQQQPSAALLQLPPPPSSSSTTPDPISQLALANILLGGGGGVPSSSSSSFNGATTITNTTVGSSGLEDQALNHRQ